MTKGLFVVVEGPNGAGKSTFCRSLVSALQESGLTSSLISEPSNRDIGKLVRHYRELPQHKYTLGLLLAADRFANIVEDIEPAVQAGSIVISDRYLPSMLVYQRLDGLPSELISSLSAHVRVPDLTILISTSREEILNRIHARGSSSHSENLDRSKLECDLYDSLDAELIALRHNPIRLPGSPEGVAAAIQVLAELRSAKPS